MMRSLLLFLSIFFSMSIHAIKVPNLYYSVRENLIYHKHDDFKLYYGGPIDSKHSGPRWIMPSIFLDNKQNIRAVYEIVYINCLPETSQDARIEFIITDDINIKMKNILNDQYTQWMKSIHPQDNQKKIVVRKADVAMVTYPDVYIQSEQPKETEAQLRSDQNKIANFLARKLGCDPDYSPIRKKEQNKQSSYNLDERRVYEPILVATYIEQQLHYFEVLRCIEKHDDWKMYYVIRPKLGINNTLNTPPLVRIDSGCVSGQLYDDDACDCLDQLYAALKQMVLKPEENNIVIHIPTQDGRGFGTAAKAETEIYKKGGQGFLRKTEPMDTIAAAKLLYQVDGTDYDIRTYKGVAELLKFMGLKEIDLLTDNVRKVSSIMEVGIAVNRKGTKTHKKSCQHHLQAKKKDALYY